MTTFSTEVTNHRSVTNTKNPTTATEGNLKCSSATVSVAAADNDGKILHMLPIHSSWSIKSILVFNDAITGGTSYDLGLYTNAATPAAVDVDVYGTAIDMSSARTTAGPLNALAEVRDHTLINNKVHQDAAVTNDPLTWYLLSFTANTVGSAQGDITIVVHYTE